MQNLALARKELLFSIIDLPLFPRNVHKIAVPQISFLKLPEIKPTLPQAIAAMDPAPLLA